MIPDAVSRIILGIPLTKGSDPDWYRNPVWLSELYRWLRERAAEPDDAAYFMERAEKWETEWLHMRADEGDMGALALLERRAEA